MISYAIPQVRGFSNVKDFLARFKDVNSCVRWDFIDSANWYVAESHKGIISKMISPRGRRIPGALGAGAGSCYQPTVTTTWAVSSGDSKIGVWYGKILPSYPENKKHLLVILTFGADPEETSPCSVAPHKGGEDELDDLVALQKVYKETPEGHHSCSTADKNKHSQFACAPAWIRS